MFSKAPRFFCSLFSFLPYTEHRYTMLTLNTCYSYSNAIVNYNISSKWIVGNEEWTSMLNVMSVGSSYISNGEMELTYKNYNYR